LQIDRVARRVVLVFYRATYYPMRDDNSEDVGITPLMQRRLVQA
jgi:hypothetical protein